MQSNLADRPRGVIASTDELVSRLGSDLGKELGHQFGHRRSKDVWHTDGEITDERICGLADGSLRMLRTSQGVHHTVSTRSTQNLR